MSEHIHIDDLLVKHLLGEANAAEQAEVTAWLNEDEGNRKHYEQLRSIWVDAKKLAQKSTVDENAAWARFQQRVEKAEQKESTPKTIPLSGRFNWVRVAAMLVLLLGGGWAINHFWMNDYNYSYVSTENEIYSKTLPDGTVVTLNKNSSIKYDDFEGATRKVILTGEAFFDVAPNKNQPFVITADDAEIKVVGTSFNVKSSGAKTEVIVETGIVEVSKKQHMVKLQPKEKATVLKDAEAPVKGTVEDVLYNYYRTKELVCDNTPLWRLADVLNEVYNVNITIADARVKDMAINTTFKDESLDNILLTIEQTLNVKTERNGKNIIIR